MEKLKAPVGSIQANDARTKAIETNGQFSEPTSKGGIVAVRWGEQEMHGQAGTAAKQGMDPIAAQQWAGMVCRSVTGSGIGIGSAPGQDGSTIENPIASCDQTATHGTPDGKYKEGLKGRCSCCLPAFAQLRRARNARPPTCVKRQAAG